MLEKAQVFETLADAVADCAGHAPHFAKGPGESAKRYRIAGQSQAPVGSDAARLRSGAQAVCLLPHIALATIIEGFTNSK